MSDHFDAGLATVQAALDPAVFVEAFAAGQQMTLEDALPVLLDVNRVQS